MCVWERESVCVCVCLLFYVYTYICSYMYLYTHAHTKKKPHEAWAGGSFWCAAGPVLSSVIMWERVLHASRHHCMHHVIVACITSSLPAFFRRWSWEKRCCWPCLPRSPSRCISACISLRFSWRYQHMSGCISLRFSLRFSWRYLHICWSWEGVVHLVFATQMFSPWLYHLPTVRCLVNDYITYLQQDV